MHPYIPSNLSEFLNVKHTDSVFDPICKWISTKRHTNFAGSRQGVVLQIGGCEWGYLFLTVKTSNSYRRYDSYGSG
jgi:hypothetical protein